MFKSLILNFKVSWSKCWLLFLTKYKDPQIHYSFEDCSLNELEQWHSCSASRKCFLALLFAGNERTTWATVSEAFGYPMQEFLSSLSCLRQAAHLWLWGKLNKGGSELWAYQGWAQPLRHYHRGGGAQWTKAPHASHEFLPMALLGAQLQTGAQGCLELVIQWNQIKKTDHTCIWLSAYTQEYRTTLQTQAKREVIGYYFII